ncbi:Ankyrin repeat-containing protein [Alteracholeplasma palmae J233]|uniref:Ankyrin repeat-containing protein n=1 Tax=Alteracholeplasma palmae (strain ATCC 49389 / J233) TaxID=1318466 RepID=U4KJM4_ALTPJ|nr:ankyrin repeat domain-containing protein [Alteracholeplasma palmae]CCV63588.1 Ankyrin repeat-containing protein [Alteracholeplasma palmae J233]
MSEEQKQIEKIKDYYEKERNYLNSLPLYKAISNLEIKDEYDDFNSLAHIAVLFKDLETLKYLIEKEVNLKEVNTNNDNLFHMLARNNRTIQQDENTLKQIADILLSQRVSLIRKNNSGYTAVHLSVIEENIDLLTYFINNNVNLTLTDNNNQTLLHLIVHTIKELNQKKEYTRFESDKNEIDEKILKLENITKELISKIDSEIRNKDDKRAVDLSISYALGKLSLILNDESLEENDETQLKVKTKSKTIHQAIKDNDSEAFYALLELGADVNEVYQESPFLYQTPLMVAMMQKNIEFVKVLLENNADPNFKTGEEEKTALFFFISYTQYKDTDHRNKVIEQIIDLLIKHGLNINDTVDKNGHTAVNLCYTRDLAVRTDTQYGSFKELVARTLISKNADINIPNNKGINPIMNLIIDSYQYNENTLLDLLENEINLDQKDELSQNLVIKAAQNRNESVMLQYLNFIEQFGQLKTTETDIYQKIAFDYATENNYQQLATWLIERM